jgi:hypothetical protein
MRSKHENFRLPGILTIYFLTGGVAAKEFIWILHEMCKEDEGDAQSRLFALKQTSSKAVANMLEQALRKLGKKNG